MSCNHEYSITQNSFSTQKSLGLHCSTLLPSPQSPEPFTVSIVCYSRMSVGILHKADFLDWLLSFSNVHLIPTCISLWPGHFFFLLNNIPLYGCATICLSSHLVKDSILAASSFGHCESSCYKYSCAGVSVWT